MLVLLVSACSESREPASGCTECGAGVHPIGILDEASPDFHGSELARRGWDLRLCATCHGDDFAGGRAKSSCLGCHVEGPTACVTCHGNGPTSGAHAAHRGGQVTCAECHVVPDRWDAPGHVLDDPPPAEVTFGARARLTPDGATRLGPPTFAEETCSNVYCHGDTMPRAGGLATRPVWTQPAGAGTCTSCHGAPPPSHAQSMCTSCHPASAPHLDGIVQLGTGCNGCHGDASSPAPPRDLSGETSTLALGVGAHRAHLDVPSGLRGPIACATCHAVPTALADAGHIDTPLPAEVAPSLEWDRATATCASSQCHGDARPVWTTSATVACGTCHGIPPATPSHAPDLPLTSCVTCHPLSVTATGAIRLEGGTSTHMNGLVDAL